MKKTFRSFVGILFLFLFSSNLTQTQAQEMSTKPDQTIFAYGGGFGKTFIQYIADLTQKENPSICYIPTAAADSDRAIKRWFDRAEGLPIKPFVLKTFISSYRQDQTFEEILLSMDAIIVSGGNTLNMMAVWHAQGIDTVLKKAYEKGIILAGGSAGSLAWFESGTTDSRPKELSIVKCLGFLPYSHSPHYSSESSRRPAYHKNILNGDLIPGYAIDNNAGIVFKNGKVDHVVQMDQDHNAYFVHKKNGKIIEDKLEARIIKVIK
jgi:dipeptidase E